MAPRSKRQRKQKDKLSLKGKSGGKDRDVNGGFAGEEDPLDSNAVILPTAGEHTEAPGSERDGAAPAPARRLSKSQQRKLRRVQEDRVRRSQRADVMATLQAHQLGPSQLELLKSVSALGQKDTKKQALRRALQLERAGLEVPAEVQLYKARQGGGAGSDSDSQGLDLDDEEGEGSKYATVKAGAWNLPPQEGTSEEESSEEDEESPRVKRQKVAAPAAAAPPPPVQPPALDPAALQQQLREAADAARAQLAQGAGPSAMEQDDAEEGGAAAVAALPPAAGPASVVLVQRPPEIEASRGNLPILGLEQEIMEAVAAHDVIVLCGETGCGKTTQVPQFLYEAGYGCTAFGDRAGAVGVTQPRRVAAIATATRVAEELGGRVGGVVGYQVRYDKRTSPSTALKFMTDGILLREVQEDFLLRRYSAVVVDEAHERSLNTDILLGMLSRIVALRRSMATEHATTGATAAAAAVHPLKLIIMSATLRTEDFVGNRRLFLSPPPVVRVPARQFPVTVHFSRRTEMHDYVGAAFKKTCQIHRTLPPGGVLLFVTGQREVEHLCSRLRAEFSGGARRRNAAQQQQEAQHGQQQQQHERGVHLPADGAVAAAAGFGEEEDAAADAAADGLRSDDGDLFGGEMGGGWSGADGAELDAAAGVDEALALAAAERRRGRPGSGRGRRGETQQQEEEGEGESSEDEYSEGDSSSGDEEEVVVLGGEGFTQEQIDAAERAFDASFRSDHADSAARTAGISPPSSTAMDPGPVHVLPLYAALPSAQQARVFRPPPPGHRLVIVSTNVAETSLTIPGVRYVVDCGRSKQRLLEQAAGLARFEVRWLSKASAEQRAGRAGRTGPGHCYRLFSSAHFNDTFPQHSPPEIVNASLEGVALALKALGVDKVANFPFPSPPEAHALHAAEQCLVAIGGLHPGNGRLTQVGKEMAKYPITPRHARMLLEVAQLQRAADAEAQHQSGGAGAKRSKRKRPAAAWGRLLAYGVALAAALSVESPFVFIDNASKEEEGDNGSGGDQQAKQAAAARRAAAREAHATLRVGHSDALSALSALCAFESAGETEAFCRDHHLHFRNLREAAALRKQLASMLQQSQKQQQQEGYGGAELLPPPPSPPPPAVMEALRRALAAGWADQVARRVRSLEQLRSEQHIAGKRKGRAVRYACCALDEDVFLHPNSALHATSPEFVSYSELVRTVKRPYMAGMTAVEPKWLAAAAAPLCTFSQPLAEPPPFYSRAADAVLAWQDVTFGRHAWQLPRHAALHPEPSARCIVFAAALLQGKVLAALGSLQPLLAVPLHAASAAQAVLNPRVGDFFEALQRGEVDSRAALAGRWAADPEYLRKEVEGLMQRGAAAAVGAAWEAALREAAA